MNHHSLHVLGYFELLELIAGYAQSETGAHRIRTMRPLAVLGDIRARRGIFEDMLRLFEASNPLPSLQAEDLTEFLVRVQPSDAVLGGEELLAIRSMLATAAEVISFFQAPELSHLSCLQRVVMPMDACRDVAEPLWRGLDVDGTLLDAASPELRDIRREIANAERRIQRQLDSVVKDPALKDILQDQFVTQRNGRYVMPVKRDARGLLPGLIHDMSSTGQTVFIEPAAIVPMGNEIATLKLRERDEIRRILRGYSALVRAKADAILRNQDIVSRLDAAASIARWAVDFRCVMPSFGGMLVLSQARHPLLIHHLRQEGEGRKAVPLDMTLPKGCKVLAITGSNTGGKTVALKTIGLLSLCAQSGLPVPVASDCLFPVFENILADIGDEQSMEANLSTFSAHIKGITEILKTAAGGHSLVLLDELGSGTDPLEGGALACGILNRLAQFNAITVATTHLGMVKNYVHTRADMVNGAVRFNTETLMPEYVLEIGRPGASHAMLIARKIGMPSEVMDVASGLLSGNEIKLEDVLSKMEGQQRRLDEKLRKADELKRQWAERLADVTQRQEHLRTERKNLMNEAYQRAEGLVENTRRDLENTMRQIKEQAKAQAATLEKARKNPEQKLRPEETADSELVSQMASEVRERLKMQEQRISIGKSQTTVRTAAPVPANQLQAGRKIWVERLQAHGRISSVSPNGKSAIVEVNGLPFTLKTSELSCSREPDTVKERPLVRTAGYSIPRVEGNTSHEINCIGLQVEEAIERLQPYISDCILAGLSEVRIVHGFGTGRLRQGIHNWLRTQKTIASFELGRDFQDSGGAGVTIVRFK